MNFFCYKCQGMFCETKPVENPSRYMCDDCRKKYSQHGKAGDNHGQENGDKKEGKKEAGGNACEAVLKARWP